MSEQNIVPDLVPARMINETLYCERLLKRLGLNPSIRVLEDVDIVDGIEAERRWVQSLFKAGVPLTNRQWRPRACVDSPEWLRGFAAALVELHRLSGESAAVRCTLESLGVTIDKARKAGVDALDLRELTKAVRR